MADMLPTVWECSPHTQAKHRILRGYLDAWFPILSRYPKAKRVLYVDGFAGPGVYEGGEPGSPLIALDSAVNSPHQFPRPVRMVFIEARRDRFEHLRNTLAQRSEEDRICERNRNVEVRDPHHGSCEDVLGSALDGYDEKKLGFGPALVFLDQFGYSDVSLELIGRIMAHETCEVFSYLDVTGIRRFCSDRSKHPAITRAFGTERWMDIAFGGTKQDFIPALAALYKSQLKQQANAGYVWQFSMHGEHGEALYWLSFCTNHIRGLEVMKEAMRRVDDSGGRFQFSDANNVDQMLLFSQYSDDWLEDHLARLFSTRTVTVGDIQRHVLENTPGIRFKKVLARLEKDGRIDVPSPPPKRRRGNFPEQEMLIRFAPHQATIG